MAERWNRMIGVSASRTGTLVTLSWFERDANGEIDCKMKYLQYYDGKIMESVNRALIILAPSWQPRIAEGHVLMAFSEKITERVQQFDIVADAEEAEQALISRYVLEG